MYLPDLWVIRFVARVRIIVLHTDLGGMQNNACVGENQNLLARLHKLHNYHNSARRARNLCIGVSTASVK
jgi:hypothetical protein